MNNHHQADLTVGIFLPNLLNRVAVHLYSLKT
jgi:hypothetical protein